MRIIAGKDSGRKILAPAASETRPTQDRIKGSLFNILQIYIGGRVCLDLFAATGNIGLEFISRGADYVYFCEKNRQNYLKLDQNINSLDYQDKAGSANLDFRKFLTSYKFNHKIDIAFLDPPYGQGLEYEALDLLYDNDLLAFNSLVVVESSHALKDTANYRVVDERKYGKVFLTFLKEEEDESGLPR